jgi:lipopolysaccharide transport system ATP-binding protein
MQPVIKAEGLSKRYALGLTHAGSVRELVNRAVTRVRRHRPPEATERNDQAGHVWALQDVSFEVHAGEVLGIIGRNGAGKSTLLKILSRITRPTEGRVELRGRVASLLEVGTGFHPELTGRENVYMNGTVLGMKRREIDLQFDSIVDFAGVEKFIDTPVKRYSSGMTVRLGFAVAAHLNPEILIIDEVLAVGDAEFQKRCIGKMDDVAKSGRTVLFVSHNMAAIRQLAPRSLLIDGGQVVFDGLTDSALESYLEQSRGLTADPKAIATMKRLAWAGDRSVALLEAEFVNGQCKIADQPLTIRIRIVSSAGRSRFRIGATIFSTSGTAVGSCFGPELVSGATGHVQDLELNIMATGLAPGRYWFRMGLLNSRNQPIDAVDEVLHFEISDQVGSASPIIQWNADWGFFHLDMKVAGFTAS